MSLSKSLVESSFRAARSSLAGSLVQVRFQGNTYNGVKASVEFSEDPSSIASLQGASGAVRLLVSELKNLVMEAGNVIEIKEPPSDKFVNVRIIMPRYDQTGATVRIDYEEKG